MPLPPVPQNLAERGLSGSDLNESARLAGLGDEPLRPPLVIGGVGGSGTRLIAEIVRGLGFYLGGYLNNSSDNLWSSLLFKWTRLWNGPQADFDRALDVFRAVMAEGTALTAEQEAWVRELAKPGRPQPGSASPAQQAETLIQAARLQQRRTGPWGWKAPTSHLFVDRLKDAFPEMRYIYVSRNGLDMAHSRNQNQLKLWGALLLETPVEVTPYWSLRYWCRAHRRMTALSERDPGRFLFLDYDAFCAAPEEGLETLLQFLGMSISEPTTETLLSLVRPPASIGRFKQYGTAIFDPEDVEYVKSLGFDTATG